MHMCTLCVNFFIHSHFHDLLTIHTGFTHQWRSLIQILGNKCYLFQNLCQLERAWVYVWLAPGTSVQLLNSKGVHCNHLLHRTHLDICQLSSNTEAPISAWPSIFSYRIITFNVKMELEVRQWPATRHVPGKHCGCPRGFRVVTICVCVRVG